MTFVCNLVFHGKPCNSAQCNGNPQILGLDHHVSHVVPCQLLEQGSGPLSQSKQTWMANYMRGVVVIEAVLVRTALPSLNEAERKSYEHCKRQRWARAVVPIFFYLFITTAFPCAWHINI